MITITLEDLLATEHPFAALMFSSYRIVGSYHRRVIQPQTPVPHG